MHAWHSQNHERGNRLDSLTLGIAFAWYNSCFTCLSLAWFLAILKPASNLQTECPKTTGRDLKHQSTSCRHGPGLRGAALRKSCSSQRLRREKRNRLQAQNRSLSCRACRLGGLDRVCCLDLTQNTQLTFAVLLDP